MFHFSPLHEIVEFSSKNMASVAKLNKFEDEAVLKELLNIVLDLSKSDKTNGQNEIADFAKTQG